MFWSTIIFMFIIFRAGRNRRASGNPKDSRTVFSMSLRIELAKILLQKPDPHKSRGKTVNRKIFAYFW